MKRSRSIQIKAALLLLVFSLNTVIGFACAVGVDMGFNTPHHQDEVATKEVHVHSDGKKHEHHKKADKHQHEETKTEKKEKAKTTRKMPNVHLSPELASLVGASEMGRGDVTKSHVLWRYRKALPNTSSPLLYEGSCCGRNGDTGNPTRPGVV